MKKLFKKLLQRAGWYETIKYSRFLLWLMRRFRPHLRQQFTKEMAFYSTFLSDCNLIFDIGANDGHKTEIFIRFAEKVVSVEPEPGNFHILLRRFGTQNRHVILMNAAVAENCGEKIFFIHHPGSAFNTLSGKFRTLAEREGGERFRERVQYTEERRMNTITLDQMILHFGEPDFIKIDTEGYELNVLHGLSQPVNHISMEFLLPDFMKELQEALEYLQDLYDDQVVYNLAVDENFILPAFTCAEELVDNIPEGKITIELIASRRLPGA